MPHSSPSKYIENASWDNKEKQDARSTTIVELYRCVFEQESIPEDGQYWSMCGAHFNRSGPLKGELGQLVECGLIRPGQYFGVDREKSIIENNKKFFPGINWIHSDFLTAMKKAAIRKTFNPSIVNYDGVMQPKFGSQYLKKIFRLLDYHITTEVLLICNFVLSNPYTNSKQQIYSIDEIGNQLKKLYWFPDHWHLCPKAYEYKNSEAKMGVVMFGKERHDIKNITYTPNRKMA